MARDNRVVYDHSEQKLHIEHTQDVEPFMLDMEEARRHAPPKGKTFRKIGTIPFVFVEKILRETGRNIMDGSKESQRYIRKWFNEHPVFKATDKQL